MTGGAPQKLSGKALSQLASSEGPELEEATDGVTQKAPEQLRLERSDAWSRYSRALKQ